MQELRFVEQAPHTSPTQVVTTTWAAEPDAQNTFLITRIKLQDLINMRSGTVNFIGDVKPKLGTLEESIDVFCCAWMQKQPHKTGMRPLVGNFNGGCATHAEAVQLCKDVWRHRERYAPRQIITPPQTTPH
jgi:hypothetical protein